jgi:hypothetical protein
MNFRLADRKMGGRAFPSGDRSISHFPSVPASEHGRREAKEGQKGSEAQSVAQPKRDIPRPDQNMNYALACILTLLPIAGCAPMHRDSTPQAQGRTEDGEAGMSPSNEARYVAIATKKWRTYFVQTLKPKASLGDVERLMIGKYRDKGRFHLGGSGSFALLYLVDDVCQIRFAFGADERLCYMPDIERPGMWIREPDGRLMLDARGKEDTQ